VAQFEAEFMRFSAPDLVALQQGIVEQRAKLSNAVRNGEPLQIVDCAADLGSMLITARQEAEALAVLESYVLQAESLKTCEVSGWFWNAYGTAQQYIGSREQANGYFARTVELAETGGWHRLRGLALHHWGRNLAEQARFIEAQTKFTQALAIRVELNEPSQESTRRCLAGLSGFQQTHVNAMALSNV
jgi:tetratricopeptide (TPR) repeat protein